MNARNKAYIGATAVFNAPRQRKTAPREVEKVVQVLSLMKDYTSDEIAHVLLGCVMMLGDRINSENSKKGRTKHAR